MVRGMESGGGEYVDEDDARSEVTGLPEEDGTSRVCEAAKRLCWWLQDRQGWEFCGQVARDLEVLRGEEKGNRRDVSFDRGSDAIR